MASETSRLSKAVELGIQDDLTLSLKKIKKKIKKMEHPRAQSGFTETQHFSETAVS